MALVRFSGSRTLLFRNFHFYKFEKFSTRIVLMSTHSTIPPKGPDSDSPSPKKKVDFARIGSLLTCLGFVYAFKAYDEGRLSFAKQQNWIYRQLGWQELPVTEKVRKPKKSKSDVSKPGPETRASSAGKDNVNEGELPAFANQELEKALKDAKLTAMESTVAALQAYCDASKMIKSFLDKAYYAVEEESIRMEFSRFNEVWLDVVETLLKRCEMVKAANEKAQRASELLCRLRQTIENGKSCQFTKSNPLLVSAEQAVFCAERELLNAKARMDSIQNESRLVEQFRKFVDDFRRLLKSEVEFAVTGKHKCTQISDTLSNIEQDILFEKYRKSFLCIQAELSKSSQSCNGEETSEATKVLPVKLITSSLLLCVSYFLNWIEL